MKRIFIAVNLPKEIKEKLAVFSQKWKDLPAKWVEPENLHLTLIFLGYLKEEKIPKVCQIVKEIASKYQPFFINFKKICYGPDQKKPPRMIWLLGEKSEKLLNLQKDLENSLLKNSLSFLKENRDFLPHITLCRIKSFQWRYLEPEQRPEIKEEVFLKIPVNSIEVMESHLKKTGPEYTVLESCKLKPPEL
jgi:2'-5' RNA ligase